MSKFASLQEAEEDLKNKNLIKTDEIRIIPFKKKTMKIVLKDKYFILDPSKYNITNLMMMIDLKKINKIEEKFEKYPDGLDRLMFVKLMKDELPTDPTNLYDEINLVYGLYKLFCEIDLSGDGIMQWSEFTQFMIDCVEGEEDSVAGGDDQGMKEKEMIKYKRYMISNKVKDYNIHKQDIITAVYYAKIDKIFVSEYNSKVMKIYNPKTGKCEINFNIENFFHEKMKEEEASKQRGFNKKQKFKIDVKKSLTFSVLHMCMGPKNMLGVCLSNNKILFFHFRNDLTCDLVYEMHTTPLQKKLWYLKEHEVWVSSGRSPEGDKYYYLYELDIEFERNEGKIECLENGAHWHRSIFFENPSDFLSPNYGKGHTGEILDVIEVLKPMLILTACIDGNIRLFNLNDKEFIKIWNTHDGAIKSLSYNPNIDLNGLILSTGFQYYINIFGTDLSLDDSFKGKLEGHNAPCVCAKFLADSYMCASVDEEAIVKIWDTNQRICLQTIQNLSKNITINNLLYIPKYNRFAIYGNKMIFYDQKYNESEINKSSMADIEVNYPIKCEFNKYHMHFFVVTLKDLRVYSSTNGNVVYIFKKFLSQERFDSETKIKCFEFDYRHRLIYMGFSNGTIQQFNAGNGSLIKPIDEYEVEKDGIITTKTYHTKDITNLFVFWNNPEEEDADFMLIASGVDSLITTYNEKDPESSSILRTIKGSHKVGDKQNEILCMDFSRRYNILGTGSVEGYVNLWDFETMKFDECCFIPSYRMHGSYSAISMRFMDPYPLLAVAYTNGALFFWGTKPNIPIKGECVFRTRNFMRKESGFTPVQISSMFFLNKEEILTFNEELNAKYDEAFLENLPNYMTIDKELQNNQEFQTKNLEQYIERNKSEFKEDFEEYGGKYPYLVIGDEKGYLKIIDIFPILRKNNLDIMEPIKIISSYNLLKTGEIHAESTINQHLGHPKEFKSDFISLYPNLMLYEGKGHYDEIISITKIDVPLCLATSSRDKRVRIWSMEMEILAEIHTGINAPNPPLKPWKFKLDWEKLKKEEIAEFLEVAMDAKVDMDFLKKYNYEEEKTTTVGTEEEKELTEEIVKNQMLPKKKRFKKIIHEEKKAQFDINNDMNETYEGRFIQEMKRKIDDEFHAHPEEIGLNEMSKNVIDNILAGKDVAELFNTPLKKSQKLQTQKKLPKITPGASSANSSIINNSSGVSKEEDKKRSLFSEKFIKRPEKNVQKSLILPLITHNYKNMNKVKFKQGETEKLLAFEYYQNSYKQCVNINNRTDPLDSLRANYRLMWSYVDGYNKKEKGRYKDYDK